MKQREKCSGRGFDSRLVHQKYIMRALVVITNALNPRLADVDEEGFNSLSPLQYIFDGPVMVSTGQRVTEWTAR